MTTEVSTSPRSKRRSATGLAVLVDNRVNVVPESPVVAGQGAKHLKKECSRDESLPPQRANFADRGAISSEDEALSLVQLSHDAPGIVAQLPLGDLLSH